MLANYDPIETGGAILGVLRDADGKIVHQLKFLKPGAAVATSLPSLMSGVAVQQQMAGIEKKLDQIQAGVDYLAVIEDLKIRAEVAAALDILSTTYDDVARHAEMTDDQWMRIANVELWVKTLHERTLLHLQRLEAALIDIDAPMREWVTRLEAALRHERADAWLGLHVQADRALTQWESLTLLRQIDNHPERAEPLVETMTANIEDRHEAMLGLVDRIAHYLRASGGRYSLLERIRFLTLKRHKKLLEDLGSILGTYRDAAGELGLELPPAEDPSLPTGDDTTGLAQVIAALNGPVWRHHRCR